MSIIKDDESPLFKTSDFIYTKRKITEAEDISNADYVKTSINSLDKLIQQKQVSIAMRLAKYLVITRTEDIIEMLNAILSFILSFFYALDTYYDNTPIVVQYAELVIIIYMLVDFMLFFYISENRLIYLLGFQALTSYITIIPTFLVRVHVITDTYKLKYLLFCRVFRFFSIFRLDRLFARRNMTLLKVYFKLIYIILATVIIFAAAMLTVENNYLRDMIPVIAEKKAKGLPLTYDETYIPEKEYQFHDMLYFMIITITTVGYGDIYPHTVYGQMLALGVIFVILSLIPKQLSEFSKVSNLTSVYARKSYSNKGKKDTKHILLLGDAPPEAIKTFLTECYHSDHGFNETNIVIMRNCIPNEEMNNILKSQNFENKVTYIEGNPIYSKDLKRCLAEKAKCCVILSNQFCYNPYVEDQRSILNALAVKKFVRAQSGKEIRLCLQLVKPEHKDLYFSALQHYNKIDQVLCVEELKLQLLAKSSICPGIITIIWSLITSNTTGASAKFDDPEVELKMINEQMKLQQKNLINASKSTYSNKTNKDNNKKQSQHHRNPAQSQNSGLFQDANGVWKERWQLNYESGTKYELYRVLLKKEKFDGLKYKDICMILFQKKGIILIALEVKIANQMKVFVNPTEYVFDCDDHYGYVINHKCPDFDDINKLDLNKQLVENINIIGYINKQEQAINKKEHIEMHMNLQRLIEEQQNENKQINYENFFSTKKPMPLNAARIKNKLDKSIEGHIIVCGIVKGIKNLILPLRTKFQGSQRRPIIILSNENLGDEDLNGDTFIWSEINRFEEIYIIKGSALNPADLERARVTKAKAIIILAKNYENTVNNSKNVSRDNQAPHNSNRHQNSNSSTQSMLDADAIFMYKTIEANYKNVVIVTELASMGAIAFLVQGNEERYQKQGYFMSRPFASGEIYVSSLLDSLMCQAYYSPKITEILDQLIMGSANTPEKIMKIYRQLNLSQSSLNLIEIPKKCLNNQEKVLNVENVFEECLKSYNMIVIGVYKQLEDSQDNVQGPDVNRQERNNRKPYVWLHPPKDLQLSIHDELFVLSDKNPKEMQQNDNLKRVNLDIGQTHGGKILKKEEKKLQKENLTKLNNLNQMLQDLLYSTKELSSNVDKSSEYLQNDLALNIKSGLDFIDL